MRTNEDTMTEQDESMKQSVFDTMEHIAKVRREIDRFVAALMERADQHDQSKLGGVELPVFAEFGPKLSKTAYGSEEYKNHLASMKVALDHHYGSNRHHPEHYVDGIDGMTLVDLVEMLADWKASTMRVAGGDIVKSIEINTSRFKITPQLAAILMNTAAAMWGSAETKVVD